MNNLRDKIKTVVHRMKFTCTIPNEYFDEIISLCQPQWISVETELPDDCARVLVTNGVEVFSTTHVAGSFAYDFNNDVTDWMPIPNLPETGK